MQHIKPLLLRPFEPGAKHIEAACHLFRKPCPFLLSAPSREFIPERQRDNSATVLPELVFMGRSNVGKSSLLEALVLNEIKVRTSNKAGCTKMANYFQLGKKLMLVDLPGYGFHAPQGHQQLFKDILHHRKCVATVCLLIDSKVGFTPIDRRHAQLMEELKSPYTFVLTKGDKSRPHLLTQHVQEIRKHLLSADTRYCFQELFLTSVKARYGLNELRCYLAARCKLLDDSHVK